MCGWSIFTPGLRRLRSPCSMTATAMRIRNLNLHHPDDDEPDVGLTIETLSALSVLARWITSAKVEAEAPR